MFSVDKEFPYYMGEHKWFRLYEKRKMGDNSIFSHNAGYKAVYPAWPAKGIPTDVVFISKSIREVKNAIKQFWIDRKEAVK